jgi:transcriptional regulator of acetoin/glycerol metabolism
MAISLLNTAQCRQDGSVQGRHFGPRLADRCDETESSGSVGPVTSDAAPQRTVTQIAAEFGVSRATIYRHLACLASA